MTNKSIFGLSENIAAALSYLFGAFSGVVVLILERENKFVRFHALQSTLFFLFLYVIGAILNFVTSIPLLGWLLGLAINPLLVIGGVLMVLVALFLMLKAYEGTTFKIPILGEVVWGQIFK
ncbi:MAG: DUF4870 domain-containing protein [Defluviitaleaceae bacterium]|nr:DUF4870 domain-containing protein [Defluviitaleaceae bacterium]MCL2239975.1 DUF4870 domain-containing protein [Defluviitaleaceae bacterium]